ncbi:HD-GYP domain-containing protein [Halanaerobium salsuginis]|jgi:putative nucleotidyltransferase with HDIG domain|uniref:HDIG domain-containing protein n=1 Tax=Halanaerobium salsuginis TaxID=29563 RepID=A0A1I4J9T1_9FIRM|nr:HD-GYP domain-containing protein [Halanaerobium salsuginis]SFL63345.1 HDIG domain-containing protein [Halanaerobium salsuginis]
MVIDEEIKSEFGGILIPPGTELNEWMIDKIIRLDLEAVKIKSAAESEKKIENKEDTLEKYQGIIENFASIFKKAYYMKKVEFNSVKTLSEEAIKISEQLELADILKMTRDIDDYTYTHSLHVGILANKFGKWLNLEENRVNNLTTAGLLHDIGKTKIDKDILTKPASLTAEEFDIVKKHPKYGYDLVKKSNRFSKEVLSAILTHHERIDGSGYLLGLKGKEIPLFGRVIAILDTFDALTTDRPYQKAVSPFKALKILEENIFGYDYKLNSIFVEKIPASLIGETVELSNGEVGKIVFINPLKPESPFVKTENNLYDLQEKRELEIKKLIKN